MLFFMGAANITPCCRHPQHGGIAGWLLLTAIVIALVEINALRGTTGPTKQPLDSVSGAITSGFVLWLILVIIIRITMG